MSELLPKSCEDCPMAFSVNFGIWGNHGVCLCNIGGDFSEACVAIEDAPMQCIEKDGTELPKSADIQGEINEKRQQMV